MVTIICHGTTFICCVFPWMYTSDYYVKLNFHKIHKLFIFNLCYVFHSFPSISFRGTTKWNIFYMTKMRYSYSVTCSFWSNVYPKDQFYLYHGMKLWQYILLPTSLFVQNIDADYFVEYYRQCHDVCRLFVFGWQTYKNVHVHCSMNQLKSAFCTDLHTSLHSIAAQNDDWNPPFL